MLDLDVQHYLDDTRDVEGWFFPIDASLFGAIDEIQRREGTRGNLFEIGVHHGKTALFLARMLREGESLGVCDVFGMQELNVDHSGEGSRELFEANLRRFGVDAARVRIFAMRSNALTVDQTTRGCRFVHVDGGHMPEDVIADLNTAAAAIAPEGVIALDDAFNANWPGVGEGLHRFLLQRPGSLAPIAIGGNKALLALPGYAERFELEWAPRIAAGEFFASPAFRFETKAWLGRQVLTAIRSEWVDLDPVAAAAAHARGRSWREQLVRLLGRGRRFR